jgi:hypothetical protein
MAHKVRGGGITTFMLCEHDLRYEKRREMQNSMNKIVARWMEEGIENGNEVMDALAVNEVR